MEFIFGGILLIGAGYLILMLFGVADNLDVVDVDGMLGLDELGDGFGCALIAVFMAVFGGFGLTGTLLGWNLIGTLLMGIAVAFMFSRLALAALTVMRRQESKPIAFATTDLIGRVAKITIASAPGETGEALVEADTLHKYPVREVDGAALRRGDQVTIVNVEGRYLLVRRLPPASPVSP